MKRSKDYETAAISLVIGLIAGFALGHVGTVFVLAEPLVWEGEK